MYPRQGRIPNKTTALGALNNQYLFVKQKLNPRENTRGFND
jgi:hypothetical protein